MKKNAFRFYKICFQAPCNQQTPSGPFQLIKNVQMSKLS